MRGMIIIIKFFGGYDGHNFLTEITTSIVKVSTMALTDSIIFTKLVINAEKQNY